MTDLREGSDKLRHFTALLAPGTPVREGLDRIVNGRTGALIVLNDNADVRQLCTGGFAIDADFTPTALRELAKMDGAIVLSEDLERIALAGVHLVPSGDIPTIETGTRHRTADRVAKQTGVPVVTVSASMGVISLFMDAQRHTIERPENIITRAGQALAALARYRQRLRDRLHNLDTLEVQDAVTVQDVAACAQQYEFVRRLADELSGNIAALGIDGRLLDLQLTELTTGVDNLPLLLEADYGRDDPSSDAIRVAALRGLETDALRDVSLVADTMGLGGQLDARLCPRGLRQLAQVPRVPMATANRLIDRFETLQALLGATTAELMSVDGVTEQRARAIRGTLSRAAESVGVAD